MEVNLKKIAILLLSFLLLTCTDDESNPVSNNNEDIDEGPTPIEASFDWTVNLTDNNHTIAIPTEAVIQFGGNELSAGSKIGVFYESNGSYKCVGFEEWEGSESVAVTVWGDDSSTDEKDGLTSGEIIKWYINFDGKNYEASVEYKEGPANYTINGVTVISSLKVE